MQENLIALNIESNLKTPLPESYHLPELPTLLQNELNEINKAFQETGERKQLKKTNLSKLLDIIVNDVSKYTLKPSSDYIMKIVRTLITKYPALAPNKDPHTTWVYRLSNKFSSLRNELKKVTGVSEETVVVPREPGQKREYRRGSEYQRYRGAVNSSPQYPDGENHSSLQAAAVKLQEHYKQEDQNQEFITSNMALTFALRRQYLNEMSPGIRQVQAKYPYLFHDEQVKTELLWTKIYKYMAYSGIRDIFMLAKIFEK